MDRHKTSKYQVLVVDDDKVQRNLLVELASRQPFTHIISFSSGSEALAYARTEPVDLLITDYRMPRMDGIELIRAFRALPGMEQIPVCMVTGASDPTVPLEALPAGANEFLQKPVDALIAEGRLANLLQNRQYQLDLLNANQKLKSVALRMISRIGEYRDTETGEHLNRMSQFSFHIAQALGFPEHRCNLIREAAPLHDIGKVGISDEILLKPGKLTPDEWEIMKTHTTRGYDMLRSRADETSILDVSQSLLDSGWDVNNLDWPEAQMGAVIARAHHEKYDGTGYPDRLRGEEIPLEARIIAVADVFDALTSERPYKRAWTFTEAMDYVAEERGKHLDPQCVDAFFGRSKEVERIYRRFSDARLKVVPSSANDEDHGNVNHK